MCLLLFVWLFIPVFSCFYFYSKYLHRTPLSHFSPQNRLFSVRWSVTHQHISRVVLERDCSVYPFQHIQNRSCSCKITETRSQCQQTYCCHVKCFGWKKVEVPILCRGVFLLHPNMMALPWKYFVWFIFFCHQKTYPAFNCWWLGKTGTSSNFKGKVNQE